MHWMNNIPQIEDIKNDIKKYDHGRSMPAVNRNLFWNGEIRSGYIITIILPVILIANEWYKVWNNVPIIYGLIVIGIIVYISIEVINFIEYDQMTKIK
jgi:hypothetical protein